MTKAQERMLEKIKRLMARDFLHHDDPDYEVKKFEVDDLGHGRVSVIIETGLVGDEGTMAQVFGRDKCHLFIGPRGGVTYPVSYKLKNGKWVHASRRLEGYSLLQASLDQVI